MLLLLLLLLLLLQIFSQFCGCSVRVSLLFTILYFAIFSLPSSFLPLSLPLVGGGSHLCGLDLLFLLCY